MKKAKFIIGTRITNAFNECLESGYYSDILKIAKIVPLY